MQEDTRSKTISLLERVKGAALALVGCVIVFFAVDNYLRVSNAKLGTTIRVPRILEWSYDTLGLVPSVAIQTILGMVIVAYGFYKLVTGR